MKNNLSYALAAIALSVFCWFLVTGRERVETWIKVRVETVGTPESMDVSGLVPAIEARVRGPRGAIQNIERGPLSYAVNLRDVKPGAQEIVFSTGALTLPRTVEVLELKPPRMDITVERRLPKKLAVEPIFAQPGNPDYKIVEKKAEPDMIDASGPQSAIEALDRMRTKPLAWPADPAARFEAIAPLDPPGGVEVQPGQVRVSARFAPVVREVRLEVPLLVAGPAKNKIVVSPQIVQVVIEAPAPLIRLGGLRDQVEAVLTSPQGQAPGKYELAYKVKMPPGCKLIEAKPEKATVVVR